MYTYNKILINNIEYDFCSHMINKVTYDDRALHLCK